MDRAQAVADFAQWMDNRSRYMAQSKATRAGDRAELPPRRLAPLLNNPFPSPEACSTPALPSGEANGLFSTEQSNG